MTSQSATLTSYYGWHFEAERTKKKEIRNILRLRYLFESLSKNFYGFELALPFCFWSKGEDTSGDQLDLYEVRGACRTFFWTFLVVSSLTLMSSVFLFQWRTLESIKSIWRRYALINTHISSVIWQVKARVSAHVHFSFSIYRFVA